MTAAAEDHRVRERAAEAVREDPDLTPAEKETILRFDKPADSAWVYTAEAGLARRLLAHPEAEILYLVAVDGDRRPNVAPENYDGEDVVGVEARLPIACLLVKGRPRASDQHAQVISNATRGGDGA
jgi:hypothetical protein